MVIAYIANLTAFFLARDSDKPVIPFKTWEEMTSQSTVSYGIKTNGMVYRMMKESKDPMFQHAVQNVETSSAYFNDVEEGIKKVRESNGKFAAVVPVSTGEQVINEEPCDLMMVGARIAEIQYGIACSKEETCKLLTDGILRLVEDNSLFFISKKWFTPKNKCSIPSIDSYVSKRETAQITARPLTIADTSLAFLVLLIGVVFGIIFLLVEILIHRRRKTVSSWSVISYELFFLQTNKDLNRIIPLFTVVLYKVVHLRSKNISKDAKSA